MRRFTTPTDWNYWAHHYRWYEVAGHEVSSMSDAILRQSLIPVSLDMRFD
jgi:hypothetical protein